MIQEKRKKRLGKAGVTWLLAGILLLGGNVLSVSAQEKNTTQDAAAQTQENSATSQEGIIEAGLMMTAVDAQGLEAPEEGAAVSVSFPAGTQVMVTGRQDGWCAVFYQGKTVYLAEKDLTASTAVDQEALEKEMKKAEAEGAAYIESLEMQRKALKRSQVWRTVIVVLIAAIFVVGVVSTLRNAKGSGKKRNGSKGKRGRA